MRLRGFSRYPNRVRSPTADGWWTALYFGQHHHIGHCAIHAELYTLSSIHWKSLSSFVRWKLRLLERVFNPGLDFSWSQIVWIMIIAAFSLDGVRRKHLRGTIFCSQSFSPTVCASVYRIALNQRLPFVIVNHRIVQCYIIHWPVVLLGRYKLLCAFQLSAVTAKSDFAAASSMAGDTRYNIACRYWNTVCDKATDSDIWCRG
jgi:hypothetical protein